MGGPAADAEGARARGANGNGKVPVRQTSSDYMDRRATLTSRMMYFAATGNVDGLNRMHDEYVLDSDENEVFVNQSGFDRRTALHLAAAGGHFKAVVWLLAHGADVHAVDAWTGTPLLDALRNRHMGVARLLCQHGAQLPREDADAEGARSAHVRAGGAGAAGAAGGEAGAARSSTSPFKGMTFNSMASPSTVSRAASSVHLNRTMSALSDMSNGQETQSQLLFQDHFVEISHEEIFWLDERRDYGKLGAGSFGEVYKAFWHNTPVAVKRLNDSVMDDETIILWRAELSIISKLVHPNIVQFLGAVTAYKPFYIVTEFCEGGSLLDRVFAPARAEFRRTGARARLDIGLVLKYLQDISNGMVYLHNHKPDPIIHRDLKPGNLLLDHSMRTLKIADFGLSRSIQPQAHKAAGAAAAAASAPDRGGGGAPGPASGPGGARPRRGGGGRRIDDEEFSCMTGGTGSLQYMAPEVYKDEPYGLKVDVFSFAMIAYELIEGEPPMILSTDPGLNAADLAAAGRRPRFPPAQTRGRKLTRPLRELTARCWCQSSSSRPSFSEICEMLRAMRAQVKDVAMPSPARPSAPGGRKKGLLALLGALCSAVE